LIGQKLSRWTDGIDDIEFQVAAVQFSINCFSNRYKSQFRLTLGSSILHINGHFGRGPVSKFVGDDFRVRHCNSKIMLPESLERMLYGRSLEL
jgi:hypothetical protein